MIRELGRSIGTAVLENVGRAASRIQERRPLPVDLLESTDAYLAVFDVPGAASSDVQVRFEDGAVEVRVDRFRDLHEGFEMRVPGRGLSLDGSVALPDDARVDADGASATLRQNGTLEVRVPKAAADDERSIDVTDESEATATGVEPDDVAEGSETPVEAADDPGES
ncbi:MAG: Hsp20/alpha crystallin family protein [Haloarculaceae archaeon]